MSTRATGARARLSLPVGKRDHILGPEDAPVTLVEYGDYECPYCGAAHSILKEVQRVMGDSVRFVFRHFPLTQIHPHAEAAAEAAESAGAQDRFWEMHDVLYQNQQMLDARHLVTFAEQLRLDTDRFARDLLDHVHHDRVREDFTSGVRSGVNGTPAFFINGWRYDGSWEFSPLLKALESASVDAAASP
ncbi:MAG TPA: DsbA family protein [Pyrinomonadaceae bacterium]|nr:DsbA family protein [Pyrinomonadaceae bacterium]